ncbi:MAG: hypothetical protein WD733_24275 [Bryobacterales bacterium]
MRLFVSGQVGSECFIEAIGHGFLNHAFLGRAEHAANLLVAVVMAEVTLKHFAKSGEANRQRVADGSVEIEDDSLKAHGDWFSENPW